MRSRLERWPTWARVLLAAVCACAECALWLQVQPHHRPSDPPGLTLAFWWWLVIVAEAIWTGLQVAYDVVVAVLSWMVQILWTAMVAVYNAFISVGRIILDSFKTAWDYIKVIYEKVLVPAWNKFWSLVTRVKALLEDIFGPVLKVLHTIRDYIIDFYKHWIRPVLDIIDAVRAILRVLEALHVKFAQQLDNTLANIEAAIDAPFQYLLAKVNEVIGWIDRIVTADGLFQRLMLIKSLQRDVEYAWRILSNNKARTPTKSERTQVLQAQTGKPLDQVKVDIKQYLSDQTGADAAMLDEMAAIWRQYLAKS